MQALPSMRTSAASSTKLVGQKERGGRIPFTKRRVTCCPPCWPWRGNMMWGRVGGEEEEDEDEEGPWILMKWVAKSSSQGGGAKADWADSPYA